MLSLNKKDIIATHCQIIVKKIIKEFCAWSRPALKITNDTYYKIYIFIFVNWKNKIYQFYQSETLNFNVHFGFRRNMYFRQNEENIETIGVYQFPVHIFHNFFALEWVFYGHGNLWIQYNFCQEEFFCKSLISFSHTFIPVKVNTKPNMLLYSTYFNTTEKLTKSIIDDNYLEIIKTIFEINLFLGKINKTN